MKAARSPGRIPPEDTALITKNLPEFPVESGPAVKKGKMNEMIPDSLI